MAETDGEVRIKVNLDTNEIDEDMQKLEDKLSKQNSALQRQSVIVERLTARYESLYEKAIQSATPNIESEKILSQINEVEIKYKELQDLYNTSKLEPNIDEAKLQQILLDLETLDKKLIDLRKRYQEAQFSPDMQNKLRTLGKEIDLAVAKEERLTNEVRNTEKAMNDLSQTKVSENIDKTAKSLERMSEKLKNIGSSKGLFESVGQSIGGIGRRIMRLASSAFVFNLISSGFREMSKGIQSLISQDNSLSISLARIRANLVTAFYPIYQAVLPAIRTLGQALAWVTGQVASFIAMLTGTSVKANQQGAKDMMIKTQGLEKEAKGYQKVGKSAKKASGELASFDKINVLKTNDGKPNDDVVAPIVNPAVSTNDAILKEFESNIPPLENKLAEMFERLKKPFEDMDLTYLNEQLSRLWETLGKFGSKIGEGLWWFYENVLAPFAKWTISEVLPRFLEILTNLLNAIKPVVDQVGEDLKWLWDEFLEPAAKWVGSKITEFLDKLIDSTKGLGDKINSNKSLLEFLSAFIIGLSAVGVGAGLWGLAGAIGGVVIATWNWTAALLANPITWIVVGIAALIAVLILCAKHCDKFNETVMKSWEAIKKVVTDTWEILKKAWNTYISPILNKMGEKFQEIVNERIKPALERIGTSFNNIVEHVVSLVQWLWNFIKPFVNWLVESVFDDISSKMWVAFDMVSNIIGDIIDLNSNLFQAIEKVIGMVVAILQGDWKRAWESAGDVVNSMVNFAKSSVNILGSIINGLINALTTAINVGIRAINRIHFDLPDWLGGGHFGLNIPEIPKGWGNIPRLSQGAVLEGGNPFLAWLGDQPKGQTNIETPLKTMVEAFNQALRQNRINEVGNVTIEASGDVGKLISFLDFKLKQENQRIGNNLVTGDVWI